MGLQPFGAISSSARLSPKSEAKGRNIVSLPLHRPLPRFCGNTTAMPELSPLIETSLKSRPSLRFVRNVDNAVKSLPVFIQNGMYKARWRVRVGKFLTDALPSLKGQVPRGWDEWTTWDNAEAVCYAGIKRIGVAEFVWQSTVDQPSKFDNTMKGVKRGREVKPAVTKPHNILRKVLSPGRVFRHEAGHAVDHLLGDISHSAGFMAAYSNDLKRLSRSNWEAWYYYIQPDAQGNPSGAGVDEVFAEGFASLYGGGCQYVRNFQRPFKESVQFIKTALADYQKRQTARSRSVVRFGLQMRNLLKASG